jgi:hypothetical protein
MNRLASMSSAGLAHQQAAFMRQIGMKRQPIVAQEGGLGYFIYE